MTEIGKNLLWSSNLWALSEGMLGPLFAVFSEKVGGDVLQITYAWASYLFIMGLGIVLVGRISDKIDGGYKILSVLGYTIAAIATFGYLLVNSPLDLLLVQVSLGIGTALASPTWSALYDKYSGDGKKDGMVWGLSNGMNYISGSIAILAGGFIVTRYSFDTLFIIMGIIMTLSAIYQMRVLKG